ncbi:hypothetical protein F5Y08DRAFT_304200 [Xylaria arbuscula]|nr:hypothetical protein F5Y08DRAFT_304200 [Xylaria arbuscula]
MTKERAAKKERKRHKKVSDDKVTKSGKQKKLSEPATTTSEEDSDGGALVNVKSPEDAPMIDSPEPTAKKSKGGKKAKKEKKSKKETQAEVEADDDTAEGGALLFSIDTNPTPVNLATVKTAITNDENGGETGSKQDDMNRQARRRIKMIEKQREIIKQKKGIPDGSREREDEVQRDLDRWTETLDRKTTIRVEKKRAQKTREAAKRRHKRQVLKAERNKKKRAGISQANA